jgi:hypothetical protein
MSHSRNSAQGGITEPIRALLFLAHIKGLPIKKEKLAFLSSFPNFFFIFLKPPLFIARYLSPHF